MKLLSEVLAKQASWPEKWLEGGVLYRGQGVWPLEMPSERSERVRDGVGRGMKNDAMPMAVEHDQFSSGKVCRGDPPPV